MITVNEAVEFLLSRAPSPASIETVKTEDALGRVLAETQVSAIAVPPMDNSAMDGYALAFKDLSNTSATLPVSQRIPAGTAGQTLQPGTAARIFTGAPIPPGADTVVIQENCTREGDTVVIKGTVNPGDHIRRAGEDIAVGQTLLEKGIRMRPQDLGLAASVGRARLPVYHRLRVAVFSTGDELVSPGEPLAPGQIYNSNRYTLAGLLQSLSCEIVDLGTVPDNLKATRHALSQAAQQANVIIATGGVSVGEEDHVKAAVEELGQMEMWRVAMKPGKPLAYGQVKEIPFLGLPGNPVSVFVTFCLFARPYLLRAQGIQDVLPRPIAATAAFSRLKPGPRREFLRARYEYEANTKQGSVQVYGTQSSGVLTSTVWANGLVEVPENQKIEEGETVSFLPFNELIT